MPRDMKANEHRKRARELRAGALRRLELGQPTEPRIPAAGPTSLAVKARDAGDDALIAAFLERKGGGR